MEILSNETHSEIITWLPHGKAFIVYQKKKFANELLPRYFKQSKFTSFTRKLIRWGFVRVTRGPETGAYYHNVSTMCFVSIRKQCGLILLNVSSLVIQYFQRGDMKLCIQMTCQTDRSSRNKSLQGIEYNALNAIPPTPSGPSAYVPPPASPNENLQALKLARKFHDNNLKVKQLAAAASLQKWLLLRASQRTQKPAPSDNPAMYPHSEYSVSIVRAAIEALNRSKFPGLSTAISSQFVSLANAASTSGFTRKTVPKAIHRSPAA